jgi:hypothetical protein
VAEESSTDNVIVGAVQFEKERLPDLKSLEMSIPAGLPKVDFIGLVQAGQKVEPFTIRDSHEEAHTFSQRADQTTAEFYAASPQFQSSRSPPLSGM